MTHSARSESDEIGWLSKHGAGKAAGLVWLCLLWWAPLFLARPAGGAPAPTCLLLEKEGQVEVARKGTTAWTPAALNATLQAGDRLRTGPRSRATLRWAELSVVRVAELTTLEIQPPAKATDKPQLDLRSGATYFFSREKPTEVQFRTPVASGAIRGTEFNLEVGADGRTTLALLEGEVDLANAQGAVALKSGEEGTVQSGRGPTKTALIDAINVIQWVLYYPAVIDPDELGLKDAEQQSLRESLEAYRNGDVLAALSRYPETRTPASDAERVFHAALLLAAGQVAQTESELKNLSAASPLAGAIREVIAAVKHQMLPTLSPPGTGSEWLARSYYLQSRGQLTDALKAAQSATGKSPRFGAAWVHLAELEFGFGRTDDALAALTKGLGFSPRNAEGLALQGFLLAAKGKTSEAEACFDQAIAADGALANAWLGRGLMKIRRGLDRGLLDIGLVLNKVGREDLQVAATLEPQRALLRSYLGKAFIDEHDLRRARKELELAKTLDPHDPTSWLYAALLDQQANHVNEAVTDLERSKELNDNRSLFRSRLLLDQDQAVRRANLASIYRDEGMVDVSVQEASRAVVDDYANYSAHLFLANSYDAMRDPKLINLRFETPWFSELLVADLLAPVSGGNLSQTVSQQEYSKLFAADGLGVFSSTEYSSHGSWLQNASQYGVFGNSSYAFDAFYRSDNGFRPNNDLEQLNLALRFKQQITDKDSIFFQVSYFDATSGDVAQYYDQHAQTPGALHPSTTLHVSETQEPNLLLGYHREWAPGNHTLFLAGRFDDTLKLRDSNPALLALITEVSPFTGATNQFVQNPPFFSLHYQSDLEAYSAELQQIWQTPRFTTIVGGRYQDANADTSDHLDRIPPIGSTTPVHINNTTDLNRISLYGYEQWQALDDLWLIGGVSYDRLDFPVNIDTSPISSQQETEDQVSPKAGALWSPLANTHLRAAYTRSLGGVFFDNSVRLEPVEVAGFNQAFRSIIPESVEGLVPGTRFTTYGVGADQSFKTGTYLLVQGEFLESDATRTVGLLTNSDVIIPIPDSPSSTRQSLYFKERSLVVAVNQLLNQEWTAGARYKLTDADLSGRFVNLSPAIPGVAGLNQEISATLNQLDLYLLYQHRGGFFGQFDAIWAAQSNRGYAPDLPGDEFWQFNVFFGYRFLQRRAEARLGVLNFGDHDYKLNPLTLYNELPRGRVLTVSLKFNF